MIKFRKAIKERGRNYIHLYQDMTGSLELTTQEQMNWTKLRFHALVAKADIRGYWLLTKRGAQFLRGEISIPTRVQTYRNKVVAKDVYEIKIGNMVDTYPTWDSVEDMQFEYATDQDIQKSIIHRKKTGKRHICPQCGIEMKLYRDIGKPNPATGLVPVTIYRICPGCNNRVNL